MLKYLNVFLKKCVFNDDYPIYIVPFVLLYKCQIYVNNLRKHFF